MKYLTILSFAFLIMTNISYAWKIEFATTPTPTTTCPNFAGFTIRIGTQSGVYTQDINVGNVTEYQIASLPLNQNFITYFFTASAYQNDSSPCVVNSSNEIAWTTGVLTTPTPPTGIIVGSVVQKLLIKTKTAPMKDGNTTYFAQVMQSSVEKAKIFRSNFGRVESSDSTIISSNTLRNKLVGVINDSDKIINIDPKAQVIFNDMAANGIDEILIFEGGKITDTLHSENIKHVLLRK